MALVSQNIFLTTQQEDLPKRKNYRLEDSVTLLYCLEGSMDAIVNEKKVTVLPQHVFVVLPNTFMGEITVSYDFKFIMLRVKAKLFQEILLDNFRIEPRWWEKQSIMETCPSVHLEPYYQDLLLTYYHIIGLFMKDPKRTNYRTAILHSCIRALILELLNYLDNILEAVPEGEIRSSVNQSDYIFQKFLDLLHSNPHEREVQWFAEKMGITPKYLSEICKQRSAKSASEWIVEVTMNEIKQRLLHTPDSIKEIAYQLGFPNSSFFCQYVRKHTGMTPIQLRKKKTLQ